MSSKSRELALFLVIIPVTLHGQQYHQQSWEGLVNNTHPTAQVVIKYSSLQKTTSSQFELLQPNTARSVGTYTVNKAPDTPIQKKNAHLTGSILF